MPDLRPGNRGIGVSVAVGHTQPYGENLARIVIRKLVASDEETRDDVVIEPGVFIESSGIRRTAAPDGADVAVYVVEFEAGGRRLVCPLVEFQARTQMAASRAAGNRQPSEAALAN